MADIYMHQRMAHDFIKHHPDFYDHDTLKNATIVASQGPDPLYYRIFSKQRARAMDIGNTFHDEKTAEFLTRMVQYVKTNYSKSLHAFLMGYVLHYTLDVQIHPYVYHHVGVFDKNDPKTYHQRGLHLKFERRMDKCLIEKDHAIKAHKYPLKKAVPFKKVPRAITKMLDGLAKDIYGINDVDTHYQKGYQGMRFTIKHFINDRSGVKKRMYRFLDRFSTYRDLFFEDLSFFYKKHLRYDYLNETNRTWHHPVTSEASKQSVLSLYGEALKKAFTITDTINQYLNDGNDDRLTDLFENRSYNKGVDCDDDRPMKDFNIFTEN